MLDATDKKQGSEEQTPTTPRPNAHFDNEPSGKLTAEKSTRNTPTRHSFGGVAGQKPLPHEPVTPLSSLRDQQKEEETKRMRSEESHRSHRCDSQDVEMGEGDDDDGEEDGSDNESITSDSQRPSKKKTGQRFFCTDFPPCQLSFTRSEHLARHIRYVLAHARDNVGIDNRTGSIQASGHSNAIARDDSLDLTICASMPRLCTLTKKYRATPSQLPVPVSKGKYEPIGCGLLRPEREHRP